MVRSAPHRIAKHLPHRIVRVLLLVSAISVREGRAEPADIPPDPGKSHLILRIAGDVRDELAIFQVDRAVRKVKGVLQTESALRERRITATFDPRSSLPVAPIRTAVKSAGFDLSEMVLQARGTYYQEGYRKFFRIIPGKHVFRVAEGPKTQELSRIKPPAVLRLQARIDLNRFESPFILVVKTFESDE